MALTKTQVINNGLALIKANLIADPSEASESARNANRIYEQTVQSELEAHAWYFAKVQASLPAALIPPVYKFSFAYPVPSDFLRLVELEDKWVFSDIRLPDTAPDPLYEMQGRSILTGLSAPLNITYIADVTASTQLWAASFSDVVSAALACDLAMPLTAASGMVELAQKEYEKAVRAAKHANAIQMPPQLMADSSWMSVRAL